MTAVIRAFRRADGEQVTALVNAHVQAVLPGVSVPQNAVLSQLERDPGEFIVDPWVEERRMLVAESRGRVVAAALLHRYADEEHVKSYRGSGSIQWLLYWRDAPFWPDASAAGSALMAACIEQLESWRVRALHAGGELPAPAVYGVPDCWPHIIELYERAGFEPSGRIEIVLVADVADIPRPARAPIDGLELRRELGINGTRFSAVLDGQAIAFVEVESDLTRGGARARFAGWADIGNLHVDEAFQRRGVASWLLGQASGWLDLGRVDRLLAYAFPADEAELAFLRSRGFGELIRTQRGWTRPPGVNRAASA